MIADWLNREDLHHRVAQSFAGPYVLKNLQLIYLLVAWAEKAVNFKQRHLIPWVKINGLNLSRNEPNRSHKFRRFVKFPSTLVKSNDGQLQENAFHLRQHLPASLKNLPFVSLSVDF